LINKICFSRISGSLRPAAKSNVNHGELHIICWEFPNERSRQKSSVFQHCMR